MRRNVVARLPKPKLASSLQWTILLQLQRQQKLVLSLRLMLLRQIRLGLLGLLSLAAWRASLPQ